MCACVGTNPTAANIQFYRRLDEASFQSEYEPFTPVLMRLVVYYSEYYNIAGAGASKGKKTRYTLDGGLMYRYTSTKSSLQVVVLAGVIVVRAIIGYRSGVRNDEIPRANNNESTLVCSSSCTRTYAASRYQSIIHLNGRTKSTKYVL